MFKKRKRKSANEREEFSATGEAEIVSSDSKGKPGEENEEGLKLVVKKAKASELNQFSTSTTTTAKKKADVGHSFESSKSIEPAQYGGGATATNEIDTSVDQDARAILERKIDDVEEEDGDKKVYKGMAAYKAPKSAEEIRASKYKGTLGPLRAPSNLRVSSRFDYQPDTCKDYRETGYCGYGDNCIYAHIREDTKSGDQLEREWALKEKKRQIDLARGKGEAEGSSSEGKQHEKFPFACHICRKEFVNPVVTLCGHYFCSKCAFKKYGESSKCSICGEQTKGVFNAATALIKHLEKKK